MSVFAVHPRILRFEEEIRCLSHTEVTGFFSEDGTLLLKLQGMCVPGEGCGTVIPDDALDVVSGQIMTHNHPSDASFTGRDLREASYFTLKEIRVVGRTGLFSMRPDPDGWPPPGEMVAKFEEIWNSTALARRVARVMGEKACHHDDTHGEGGRTAATRLRVRSDHCCELVAEELHLRYRKADRPCRKTSA